MRFTKIAATGEIPTGTMKSFRVKNNLILVANIGGRYFAMSSECTHAGIDLSRGTLNRNIVTCPHGGSQYDVTTGACKKGPAFRNAEVYEVEVDKDGNIRVKI
jgi:3-phenylpropionate/trans-cinnamate dioxygenase ferredoxin component